MAAVEEFVIQRAERTQVKLRIALQGSSGGGKTATSLMIARGMVAELERRGALPGHLDCHIGLLDTERDSAKLYSHLVPFDTIVLQPPYSPSRYLKALSALERAGYSVIIVDQITHEWYGEGGVLQMVRDSKEQNDFAKWNGPSQEHELFIDTLLKSPAHLIVTMRSKTAWVLEDEVGRDGRTRKKPKRIGMQAKQREGTEYEFTTLLDLEVGSNSATCLKDRTELFVINEQVGRMGPDWGKRLIDWVYSAKKPEPAQVGPSAEEQCIAVADAGVRACERAANVPDLQLAFESQQRAIKAFQPTAGAEVVKRELARLVEAKDLKKGSFGRPNAGPAPADVGETISPDDMANLELLVSDAGLTMAAVKAQFGVAMLAHLPVARFDECQAWIHEQALAQGRAGLPTFTHRAAPAEGKGPREVLQDTVTKIGNARGGLFSGESAPGSFSDMKDDIPRDSSGQ